MKRSYSLLLSLTAMAGFALSSSGATLVNDTWADGDRTSSSPGGDSAWFWGGTGSLTVVAPGGPMRGDLVAGGTSSASWTTYFAPSGSPATLASAGDKLRVTWQFTLTGVAAANGSQNFRLALVNTPTAARLAADAAPGSSTYAGYGMFMNMASPTLGNGNPFQLMERSAPATSSALLSAGASWTALGNGATTGNNGYAAGVLYTYMMDLTLNGSGGLDIISSMTGGTLNNSGTASVSVTDATPNSLSFDTFSIRPSSASGAAQIFDSSLFKVELFQVPEPSAFAMLGMGALGFVFAHRRNRR
jgi:hypothetical protein